LNTLDRRHGRHPVAQVGDRHAVERVVVAAARAAAKRHQRRVGLILLPIELRVAGRNDRGDRSANHECVSAGSGKSLQRRGIEDGARGRVRRIDERRLAGDRDVLGNRPDFHREVEREELLRADANPAAIDRLVTLERRLDPVGTGIDVREDELAALVCDNRALDVRLLVGERHLDARDDAASVLDRAA